ncbi:dNTP triphosphohydrolase [Ruficoccus amylovorans]|uniref:DNTP triphosphohydrolase n=1 Tax=Ruficoccus amylovorans TaxID=1804625 RepID=A0A842HAL9_9BACT|nr:dNTP triphosphohydrolase [Ruficoccus amylovorans]MBC2593179.1 dNTP triphosphohydrolase [Ruficoccus amylovorans]
MPEPFYRDFDNARYGSTRSGDSDERSPFQLDRDRVVFSYAFRRLQSKTQVFQSGEYDFYRTRLTHSLEVARIARSIGEHLNRRYPEVALDGDLLEAVGLSHDLGHPPFGHIGERKLNELMAPWGGFEGNAQTARILTETFWQRKDSPHGMSPSRAFLDGILKYKALWMDCCTPPTETSGAEYPENHFLYDEQAGVRDFVAGGEWPSDAVAPDTANTAKSLECQVMDWADDTAYSLHDIVDSVKAGYLTRAAIVRWAEGPGSKRADSPAFKSLLELLEEDYLEAIFARKLGEFIRAVELVPFDGVLADKTARYRWRLQVPEEILAECSLYKKIAFDLVFRSPRIQQVEFKSGFLIERLFKAFFDCHLKPGSSGLKLLPEPALTWVEREEDEHRRARLLCDTLTQLTDHEAIRLYRHLFDPEFGSITDLL